jgi:fibronectin type 3 domain-containing protein
MTGQVSVTSNSSSNPTAVISLSGTGQARSSSVDLSWTAPSSSPDPVAGYNVYRATGSGSSYQLLNSTADTATTYADTTVASGTSYTYYVESVDAEGCTSGPSNTYTVNIP